MKKAGMTVEASLVIPVVIWIVFLVICHVLVQGDRMSALLMADSVLEEVNAIEDYEHVKSELEKNVSNKIADVMLFHKLSKVDIEGNDEEYSIDITLECMVDISFLKEKVCRISRSIHKDKICRTIRRRDVATDMLK